MSNTLKQLAKEKFSQTWKLYLLVFIPMWAMFGLNNTVLFGMWNFFGIEPREFALGNLVGILASWTMHANLAHIIGNSIVMAQLLFLFGLFERNAFRTLALLTVGSGFLTWLLGSDNSIHVGASGLVFAMMGYMIGSALFARRWGYMFACAVLGTGFWFAMIQGLIPQTGISFAGHFGGMVAGLLYGADSERIQKRLGRR